MKRTTLLIIVFLALLIPELCSGQAVSRFPKPDFQTDYVQPELVNPQPRPAAMEIMDIIVLIGAMSLASWFVLKDRSRRKVFILMIASLIYFGFIRRGCICSVGSVQNIAYAFFNSSYLIPVTALAFFVIPLLFTLFFGRTFCAAVCPLGAVQDLVILKPVKVPGWLRHILSLLPYFYLGLAVLFAATGAGFIICQYDPFVGFFRFGAEFNLVLLGVFMLILGTVVARPYCRFLCPYGVLLRWMSRLSRRHITITPDECNNCRLCEASCPFDAIDPPDEGQKPEKRQRETGRLALLLILLPLLMFAGGWSVSKLYRPLSRYHFTVSLAEEVRKQQQGLMQGSSDKLDAFRSAGKTAETLFAEEAAVIDHFRTGSWLLGIFLGLVIGVKLIRLSIRKKREFYTIDRGSCLSCARCVSYCPYELVRLGIITPEEIITHERKYDQ